jgi:hypothetical protein
MLKEQVVISQEIIACPHCGSKYIPAIAGCYKCYEKKFLNPTLLKRITRVVFSIDFLRNVLDLMAIYGVNFILMRHMHYTFTEGMIQSLSLGWFASYIVNSRR